MEKLYIADKIKGKDTEKYIVKGFVERKYAEEHKIRHVTTIIVPFIVDGDDKGKWIVHNRLAKQQAKYFEENGQLKPDNKPSYNLLGGHCTVLDGGLGFGDLISEEFLLAEAMRELEEEAYLEDLNGNIILEVWGADGKKDESKNKKAKKYTGAELIRIGFTEYESKNNVEYSYVFALPVKSDIYNSLLFADDYKAGHNVYLEKEKFHEAELKYMHENEKTIEICDAITRLWLLPENEAVLNKLRDIIIKKLMN